MRYTWDFLKNISNHQKHGIWFSEVIEMLEGDNYELTFDADHSSHGEDRWIAKGYVSLYGAIVVIFVEVIEGDLIRIISARKE